MHIESQGVDTGDASKPFVARVTIGSKRKRDVLAEFESATLAAAHQEAEDWMEEYCARVGLGGPGLLTRSAMEARWGRLRADMPLLPEPGDAYCRALEAMSSYQDPHDLLDEGGGAPQRPRRRPSYATRAKIVAAVAAARAASIDVAGVRIWPDGSIAAFDSRGVIDQQANAPGSSAYDEWKASRD